MPPSQLPDPLGVRPPAETRQRKSPLSSPELTPLPPALSVTSSSPNPLS